MVLEEVPCGLPSYPTFMGISLLSRLYLRISSKRRQTLCFTAACRRPRFSPIEIVDYIRNLGWQGVMGNSDEMLVQPDSLENFASQSSAPAALWAAIRKIASATRSALGEDRLAWLREQPLVRTQDAFALVHASPDSCWRAPAAEATDVELKTIYGPLDRPIVVFGHTHYPSIRHIAGHPQLLINTGSVGLPYDGDPRASYLLLEGNIPSIRRVEYDLERELKALSSCGLTWCSVDRKNAAHQLSADAINCVARMSTQRGSSSNS